MPPMERTSGELLAALTSLTLPRCGRRNRPGARRRSGFELAGRDSGDGAIGRHGHVAQAGSGGGEDGVAYRRGQADQTGFTGAGGGDVLAVDEHDFDLRSVAEAGKAVALEVRILDVAVAEQDGLKERAADALDDGAHVLIAQAVGVDDGPRLPGLDDANDFDFPGCRINRDFGAGGGVAAFFHSAGDAESAGGCGLRICPAELIRGGAEAGKQAGLGQVLPAEGGRGHAGAVCPLIHKGLAGEVVGRGSERAIGAYAERRLGRVVFGNRTGYVIGRREAGVAGVVVVMLPGDEGAVVRDGGLELHEAGGAEVGPGELLFAGPDELDRLASGLGETGGFDGSFAGVLASVARAHVGLDDADFARVNVEGGDEFVLDAERALRAGPDRELAGRVPLGDGGAGFERSVRDVLDGVGLRE